MNSWKNIPPLNSLRAFSLVAQTNSFLEAGNQLNVTQAAISQQIKILEDWLSLTLINRNGRGAITLTDAGKKLAHDLQHGFDIIQNSIQDLIQEDQGRPVQITASPAFTSEWLMPRLSDFQARFPDITLMLNPTAEFVDLKHTGIDLAIRYYDHRIKAQHGEFFMQAETVLVGKTDLFDQLDSNNPASMQHLPWLEELGTKNVQDWFQRHNVTPTEPLSITQMPGSLIIQSLRRGEGITQTVRDFISEDLQSGDLTALFPEPKLGCFRILTGIETPRPSVKAFKDWLLELRPA
ncbi:LysR family transcriptional regulator [Curvivirga sp.]|uniref:LysR family transcriptional regulator n=1 Tax=Curvivirga sp. TaxID=2856848 RepID=UPI003B59EA5F